MSRRILYVEDDQFLRDWVEYELASEGYRVDLASDGMEGLYAARSDARPDLIILDIGLPEMDGFQLCRALQAEHRTADIPVIFLSARQAVDDRLQGFQAGGMDYLPKPFAMAELKARVQSGLRRQQLGRNQERRDAAADMREASLLQNALMQRCVIDFPSVDLAAFCRPARHVAGDWYDFQALADETLYLLEADVSGKGVSAALLMSETRIALQSACRAGESPATALAKVNHQLYDDLTSAGRFVTTFLGRFDRASSSLTYASAGHTALLLPSTADTVQLLGAVDPPIGIFDDSPFAERTVSFASGDLLVVCSDGFMEATNVIGDLYGFQPLFRAVERARSLPAAELVQSLLQQVDHFTGNVTQADDQTVIVLKAL